MKPKTIFLLIGAFLAGCQLFKIDLGDLRVGTLVEDTLARIGPEEAAEVIQLADTLLAALKEAGV